MVCTANPGMSVAVVEDGRPVYARGFGVRDVTKGEPGDEHTLFAIGSNTKLFTQLERGGDGPLDPLPARGRHRGPKDPVALPHAYLPGRGMKWRVRSGPQPSGRGSRPYQAPRSPMWSMTFASRLAAPLQLASTAAWAAATSRAAMASTMTACSSYDVWIRSGRTRV